MGITRNNRTKRRATGGKKKHYRKNRKYEMGRQPTHTKMGERKISLVRMRGGRMKRRAIRLDAGNFSWSSEGMGRKTRILGVVYNATSNELVRTNTLVKNAIIQIDASPFRVWYEQHYGIKIVKPKKKRVQKKTAGKKGAKAPAKKAAAAATAQPAVGAKRKERVRPAIRERRSVLKKKREEAIARGENPEPLKFSKKANLTPSAKDAKAAKPKAAEAAKPKAAEAAKPKVAEAAKPKKTSEAASSTAAKIVKRYKQWRHPRPRPSRKVSDKKFPTWILYNKAGKLVTPRENQFKSKRANDLAAQLLKRAKLSKRKRANLVHKWRKYHWEQRHLKKVFIGKLRSWTKKDKAAKLAKVPRPKFKFDKIRAQKVAKIQHKLRQRQSAARKAKLPIDKHLYEQFQTGRLYACIASRPGQDGCADGYILEGKELEFYLKKMKK